MRKPSHGSNYVCGSYVKIRCKHRTKSLFEMRTWTFGLLIAFGFCLTKIQAHQDLNQDSKINKNSKVQNNSNQQILSPLSNPLGSDSNQQTEDSKVQTKEKIQREATAYRYIMNLISERRTKPAREKIIALQKTTSHETLKALLYYWLGDLDLVEKNYNQAAQNFGKAHQIMTSQINANRKNDSNFPLDTFLYRERTRTDEILLKLTEALFLSHKKDDARLVLNEYNTSSDNLLPQQRAYYQSLKKRLS